MKNTAKKPEAKTPKAKKNINFKSIVHKLMKVLVHLVIFVLAALGLRDMAPAIIAVGGIIALGYLAYID